MMDVSNKRNKEKLESLGCITVKRYRDDINFNVMIRSSSMKANTREGVARLIASEAVRSVRSIPIRHVYGVQYRRMARLIARELTSNFGKSEEQAWELLNKVKIGTLLAKHPLSLHESPENWAIGVLTKAKEWDTLDRYYTH